MNQQAQFRALVGAIVAVIAPRQLCVSATYDGCGDSGDITEVGCEDESVLAQTITVDTVIERRDADTGSWRKVIESNTMTVDTALRDATDLAIELADHSGYENNDGGGGTLTIFPDGSVKLEHYDNYTTTESDDIVFRDGEAEMLADEEGNCDRVLPFTEEAETADAA